MAINENEVTKTYAVLKAELIEKHKDEDLISSPIFIRELNSLNAAYEILIYHVLADESLNKMFEESDSSLENVMADIARTDTAVFWQLDPGQNCYYYQDLEELLIDNLAMM